MVIGIDLNDVLRDFSRQFEKVFLNYNGIDVDLEHNPIRTFELEKYFLFQGGRKELNEYLYGGEGSLEVFGAAPMMEPNIMYKLNTFLLQLAKGNEVVIVSREADRSIPASYFFLGKTACKVNKINFQTQYEKLWKKIDVMVTANPILLDNKPNNKSITIKINSTYNTLSITDYNYNKLSEFLEDTKIIQKLFGLKKERLCLVKRVINKIILIRENKKLHKGILHIGDDSFNIRFKHFPVMPEDKVIEENLMGDCPPQWDMFEMQSNINPNMLYQENEPIIIDCSDGQCFKLFDADVTHDAITYKKIEKIS